MINLISLRYIFISVPTNLVFSLQSYYKFEMDMHSPLLIRGGGQFFTFSMLKISLFK